MPPRWRLEAWTRTLTSPGLTFPASDRFRPGHAEGRWAGISYRSGNAPSVPGVLPGGLADLPDEVRSQAFQPPLPRSPYLGKLIATPIPPAVDIQTQVDDLPGVRVGSA